MGSELTFTKDSRFLGVIPYVLNSEGGFVNNPKDPGGATNRGIAYNYNVVILREFGIYSPDQIKRLNADQAKEIYFRKYWTPVQINKILDTSYAYVVFDAAVNQGPAYASLHMNYKSQEFQGDGQNVKFYQDLRRQFIRERIHSYFQYKRFDEFGEGWMNRMADVAAFAERVKPVSKVMGIFQAKTPEPPSYPDEMWMYLEEAV